MNDNSPKKKNKKKKKKGDSNSGLIGTVGFEETINIKIKKEEATVEKPNGNQVNEILTTSQPIQTQIKQPVQTVNIVENSQSQEVTKGLKINKEEYEAYKQNEKLKEEKRKQDKIEQEELQKKKDQEEKISKQKAKEAKIKKDKEEALSKAQTQIEQPKEKIHQTPNPQVTTTNQMTSSNQPRTVVGAGGKNHNKSHKKMSEDETKPRTGSEHVSQQIEHHNNNQQENNVVESTRIQEKNELNSYNSNLNFSHNNHNGHQNHNTYQTHHNIHIDEPVYQSSIPKQTKNDEVFIVNKQENFKLISESRNKIDEEDLKEKNEHLNHALVKFHLIVEKMPRIRKIVFTGKGEV